jgi:membrane protease YdiL (CAAX protease family)
MRHTTPKDLLVFKKTKKQSTELQKLSNQIERVTSLYPHSSNQSNIKGVLVRRFVTRLRKSQGLRGAVYLGACAVLPHLAPSPLPTTGMWSRSANTFYGGVMTCAVTWVFSKIGNDGYFAWSRQDAPRRLAHAVIGFGLGLGTFGAFVAVASSLNWVRFDGWGWRQTSPAQVAATLIALAPDFLGLAVYEEILFRGYPFQMFKSLLGVPFSAVVWTVLFAVMHGLEPLSLLGQGAAGVLLMTLRLTTGSLWMPIGWHFGIWYAETALLGPPDGPPSLLPMQILGPKHWLGRPGYPEPGLLITLVYLVVAAGIAAYGWQRDRKQQNPLFGQ